MPIPYRSNGTIIPDSTPQFERTIDVQDYHLLGRTGLRVSPLALGTMTFGQADDWGTDKDTARSILEHYLAAGGNFVDTANVYADGRSEELVGQLVRETDSRDHIVLATKFAQGTTPGNPNAVGNGRKNIIAALDASLRRLQTDYVDLYWLHVWDMVTPVEEVMATFDALVRSGKVRSVGLSNVPAWYATKAQMLARDRNWEPVAALQMEYSLVARELEREIVPAALDLDMGIIPWSPLGRGFLTGRYQRTGDDIAGEGQLATPTQKAVREFTGGYSDQDWNVLDTVVSIARELRQPPARVALNWVAHRPGVTSTIVGARTLNQLRENLAAEDLELSPEQRARLDEVSAPSPVRPYLMFDPAVFERFLTPGMRIRQEPTWHRATQ
jgi:aryl-alcohol dehydrogenase-like predicted oxidoreductase